jgi:hypothetical protein
MQNTKPSISITIDLFIKGLSATACIFILMFMLWILRAIVSDIPLERLRVDDPIWLALFLSLWCITPAIPAYIAQIIKSKQARRITYFVSAIIQAIALYFAVNFMAQQPDSEIGSSILPMLVWVSIPLSALYYPLFFYGLNKNKIRVKLILVTLFLVPLWLI